MQAILDYIIGCTFILVRKKREQRVGAALIPANIILALSTSIIVGVVIGALLFERINFLYLITVNLTIFFLSSIYFYRLLDRVYLKENRLIELRLPSWFYYISFPFVLLTCGLLLVALLVVTIKTATPITN